MHIDLHTQRDFDPPCECSIAVEPTNDGALWFYIQYCDKHSAAPEMAESGTELDTAIGQAIIKIAQATKLSNALIQIIQETVLPAQEKWRKALAKAEGGTK